MNIAHVSNNYLPIRSGISSSICSFVDVLQRNGNNTHVIAPNFPNYVDESDKIIRTNSINLYYKEPYPLSTISTRALKNILQSHNIDLVHSHHPFGVGKVALRACKLLKIPIVFTYHTLYEHYAHYIPFPFIRKFNHLIKKLAIIYCNECNLVLAPTSAVADMLIISGCKVPVEVMPTGIPLVTQEMSPQNKDIFKRKMGVTGSGPVLLTVARLAEEKNLGFLLECFKNVLAEIPNATLLLVGGGYQHGRLKNLVSKLGIREKVIFVGAVDRDEIVNYYSISDVYLHPSFTETQGLPLLESYVYGLPVISIHSEVNAEIIRNLNNGVVVQNGVDFVNKTVELINHPELRTYYIPDPTRLKYYDLDMLGVRLEQIYTKLL